MSGPHDAGPDRIWSCSFRSTYLRMSEGQSYPSPKEREPDDGKYQYRNAGTDHEQRQHRRAGFRLACFVGCFDDYTVLFDRHDAVTQIFGASPTRSNTGTFSTSSGAAPEGVFGGAS